MRRFEVGPQRIHKQHLGIGRLPQQEIRQADLPAGSDQQIERWEISGVEVRGDETLQAKYLVLSEGKSPRLSTMLGLEHTEAHGIATDRNGASGVPGVYVVGRLARPGRSQAIISAGDGAAAAIDILSREKGEDVTDWDSPPEG